MSAWEHSRFAIYNQNQHPYRHAFSEFAYANPRLPGVSNPAAAVDYLVAVMYPNYIGTFANNAALAAYPTPAANDYAIVSDDGDGKAAGYVYFSIDGVAQWSKRYDVDWSLEGILAETINRTQYMYVQKFGMTDKDSTGNPLVGINAGQHIYGGDLVNQNLTLHANAGDTLGTRTGFIQVDDSVRPTVDLTLDLGDATHRFLNLYASIATLGSFTTTGNGTVGGDLAVTGNETVGGTLVVTGTITGSNLSGTNTGDVTLAAIGAVPNANGASLTGQVLNLQPASAAFGGVLTTGVQTIAGAKTFSGAASFTSAGTGLTVSNDALISGNLTVTGTINGGTLSGNNSGDVTLAAIGAVPNANGASLTGQVLNLQPASAAFGGVLTTGAQTIAGAKTLSGALSLTAAGTALSVTNDATISGNLTVVGNLSDGTTNFVSSELQALRNVKFRDAARTQAVQTGDSLFFDAASGTWLASVPDTEIVHNTLSGLTTGDAGHTQFVMLAGRAGGQSVQGGTAASENLVLESTANAVKGSVKTKDNFVAFTNASFAGTWSGTDLGDATHAFRDVYTKGQFFGLRLENNNAPVSSAQNPGRLIYGNSILSVDNGVSFDQAVMTVANQTVAGVKTFTGNLLATAKIGIGTGPITPNVELDLLGALAIRRTDVATAATIASLASATGFVKFTGATATALQGVGSGFDGKQIMIYNGSSAVVTVKNQNASAAAADRIITSTGGDFPLSAGQSVTLVYDSNQSRWVFASSAGGSGGGGGGSLEWIEDDSSPVAALDSHFRVYQYPSFSVSAVAQQIYAAVKVPQSYVSGSQIKMYLSAYSPDNSGTFLMQTVSTLVRTGVDVISSTTNQRTSTNGAIALGVGTVNIPQAITFDITDVAGAIGGVAVSAGDTILVKLTRGSDSGASDVSVPVFGAEVKFS